MEGLTSENGSFVAEYEFSANPLVVSLSQEFRDAHNVKAYNITVPYRCFGSGVTLAIVEWLIGCDTIIINQLMYALQSDGQLKNTQTQENWLWTAKQIAGATSLQEWLASKFWTLFYSLFSFSVISMVTALVVRILISSGVAVMFPFFFALRSMGMNHINLRILTQSYPWLGFPVEHLQAANLPTKPLIL